MNRALRFALLITLLMTPVSPAQLSIQFQREAIQLRGNKTVEGEFGFLKVSENRVKSKSGKISLAILRVPSLLENPGPPVFMLAGGPGGSSIEMVKRQLAGGGRYIHELFRGDLIAIDQRGVGLSKPNLESDVLYHWPMEEPGDPAKMLRTIQSHCKAEARRWREKGVDLSGYTTIESADDIDAVRRALGYDKIVLWGESYGSHLALATIRRHEKHIERAVLVCPEAPDDALKLPSDAQDVLERLGEALKSDGDWSRRIPDLVGLIRTVLHRIEKKPNVVEIDGVRVGVSKFDVQCVLADKLTRTRRGVELIPATALAMSEGDFTSVARDVKMFRESHGIGSAMAMVMDSASGASKARAARIKKEAEKCVLGDAINFPYPHVARAWGAPDLGDAFRAILRSEVPVLMIVGDLDSRTTVRGTRELMQHLPGSSLVVVTGVAHDVPWGVRDIHVHWAEFLKGRDIGEVTVNGPPIRFSPMP